MSIHVKSCHVNAMSSCGGVNDGLSAMPSCDAVFTVSGFDGIISTLSCNYVNNMAISDVAISMEFFLIKSPCPVLSHGPGTGPGPSSGPRPNLVPVPSYFWSRTWS